MTGRVRVQAAAGCQDESLPWQDRGPEGGLRAIRVLGGQQGGRGWDGRVSGGCRKGTGRVQGKQEGPAQ